MAYSEDGRRGVDKGTDYTDRVAMDADDSLVIRAVEVSDERNFTCRVMASASGSSEVNAHLKVYGEAPTFRPIRCRPRQLERCLSPGL